MARVTVLQLDTRFPRVPGDVACPETYRAELEILRVPRASVARIVIDRPETIDIAPFEKALSRATGDLIVTSCGFLAPFQETLAAHAPAPFLASALQELPALAARHTPDDLRIVTFDGGKLGRAHLPVGCAAYAASIVGLPPGDHLARVIAEDLTDLDTPRAAAEMAALATRIGPEVRALLLECTNLPPYKPALMAGRALEIHDILTAIEARLPGAVDPRFL